MKRIWGGRLLSIGIAFGLMATHTRATGLELSPSKAAEIQNFVLALTIAGTPQVAASPQKGKPVPGVQGRMQETTCLANAKQVTAAILLYVKANKGVTPKDADYRTALSPYNKKPEIFQCPLDPKDTLSYTLNSNLAGTALNTILLPSNTVLIYEGTGGKLNFRHNGHAVVGFADGHCTMVDASKASTLSWTVQPPKTVNHPNKKPSGK